MSGIAITFPGSPAEGQSYLAQNGFTYIYDSQKNRWKRGGDFVRAPKVLSYAGIAATTTGSGITTGPTGSLIYVIPGTVNPTSDVGVDSYKAYRYTDSYPNYTEIQVSISSAFSSIAYAATSTSTTFTIPASTLSGDQTYYLRARQFVGSDASAAGVGAISGYSANPVKFTTASVFLDTPTIVSIAGTSTFPVYQIGFAGTTLPATVTYTGSGVGNLEKVEWRVTGPRNPDSTGDTALAEVGIGTFSSATLANALVLAMPFSGATGVGITNDVNNAIRTASGASAGTTKTVTANGNAGIATVGTGLTSHFYNGAAYFDGSGDYIISSRNITDLNMGTGDFTIEFWLYFNDYAASDYTRIFSIGYGGSGNEGLIVELENATGNLYYYVYAVSGNSFYSTSVFPKKSWKHIAFCRRGDTTLGYIDGVLVGTQVLSAGTSPNFNSSTALVVGCWEQSLNATYSRFVNGYIQDFKLYKGLAKYTENFTPPLPTYGTISYTTSTIGSVGVATTAFFESTGDIPTAEVAIGSSTAAQVASSLVLAMPLNNTFSFQDINVAVRGLTSGASAGTAKTVGLGTTSTANAPSHPIISSTESKWYDGAAYFDGGDYGQIDHTTDLDLGSGDFSFECWVYPTSNPGNGTVILSKGGTASNDVNGWTLLINGSNIIQVHLRESTSLNLLSSNPITFNTWTHILVSRNSGTARLFVNGILNTSSANTYNIANASYPFYVGRSQGSGGEYWSRYNGYLQDLKVYKGFAKYTANFTPPQPICGFTTDLAIQTGFTTTSATGALLSSVVGLGSTSTLAFGADQTYAGITSITSSSGITTLPDTYAQNLVLALPLANITGVGNSFTNDRNTQIRSVSLVGGGVTAGVTKTITNTGVTTVSLGSTSKWYGNTASFNGTSQYFQTPHNVDFNFGSGNFTIEGYVKINSLGAVKTIANYIAPTATTGNDLGWIFNINASNQLEGVLYSGTSAVGLIQSGTLTTERWYHVAYVRSSSSFYMFLDGTLIGTATGTSSHNTNVGWNVSFGYGHSGGTQYMNGYLQDIKIYKGTAKYTTNFTPPPPMFGDYVRSTPNKVVFTPGSDYVLEARNTASGGIVTTSYSASRQWGTKPEGGIYDPYGANLVLAIPGGAVGGATSTFDVTGQIRFETPTASYVNAGIVTYSNSLGIGTYGNKSVTNNGPVSISSTITKYYSRSMQFNGSSNLDVPDTLFNTTEWTFEAWIYKSSSGTRDLLSIGGNICSWSFSDTAFTSCDGNGVGRGTVSVAHPGLNTWFHLAFVQLANGTDLIFINGIRNDRTINIPSGVLSLGNTRSDISAKWIGHMQDVRYYNYAKYTSNFTPPNQIYLT